VKTNFAWEFLFCVYKELMIMGLISFALQFLNSLTVGPNDDPLTKFLINALRESGVGGEKEPDDHFAIEIFELVHVMVFFRALIYVVIITIIYALVGVTWRSWTAIENQERKEPGIILSSYLVWCEKMKSTPLWIKIIYPKIWFEYMNLKYKLDYQSVRMRFIKINGLESNYP
jgi:hypothetical protein